MFICPNNGYLYKRANRDMDKQQQIKEFLNFNDTQSQLTKITSYFDDFQVKSNQAHSESVVARNCNDILKSRIYH